MHRWSLCAVLFSLPMVAGAQTPSGTAVSAGHLAPQPVVRAERRRGPIHVDGQLDEAAWNAAQPATRFVQTDPHEGEPATQATEVRFLFDESALYVGARMRDSLGARGVQARLTRRDHGDEASDYLQIVLDTYHDHLGRASFLINARGVRLDAQAAGNGDLDESWDPIWEGAAHMDSAGWTAEMRIPFSQLRFSRDSMQTWGVQISRQINRLNERQVFAFWRKNENGGPQRYGHLDGIVIGDRPRHLELMPYVVSRMRYIAPETGDPFNDGSRGDVRVGGDLKYLLTSNLTLDATLNPDFGQVEVDPAVVNLSAFETFFPERRPFFIEGAGIFSFGNFSCFFCSNYNELESFYSRRIGRRPQMADYWGDQADFADVPDASTILGAAKITGRTKGGYSIGLLDAVTRRERATMVKIVSAFGDREQFQRDVEPLTNYFVGRVKKDLRSGNIVLGAIATSVARSIGDSVMRTRLASGAEMVGADMVAYWRDKNYRLALAAAASDVRGDSTAILRVQRTSARYFQRPDRRATSTGGLFSGALDSGATALRGYGAYGRLSKEGGNWLWELSGNTRSPGYEVNDAGFVTRADYRAVQGNLIYAWHTPTRLYREVFVGAGGTQRWNFDGDAVERMPVSGMTAVLANYWSIQWFQLYRLAAYDDRLTRGGAVVRRPFELVTFGTVETDGRKHLVGALDLNYAHDGDGATSWSTGLSVNVKPTPNIALRLGPSVAIDESRQQYVQSLNDPTASAFYGRRSVFSDLSQHTVAMDARVTWTFTPALSFELFAQPYLTAVRYSHFKEYERPRSLKRNEYGRDVGTIVPDGSDWTVDPDGDGPAASFNIENPDFNYRALRGNAVVRWEYRPGSALFFVWTQARESSNELGGFDFAASRRALFRSHPDNVFLVKASYWLGR